MTTKEASKPIVMDSAEAATINQAIAVQNSLKAKRRTVFLRLGLLFAASAVAAFFWWTWASGREQTDDAYIDAHISNISCRISGNIEKVFVDDNQHVQKGDVLVELDPADYQVKVDQNEAALAVASHTAAASFSKVGQSNLSAKGQTTQASGDFASFQAEIESARARINEAEADTAQTKARIVELEAQVKFAEADFERYRLVYRDKVITKQQFDKAKTSYDVAVAQLSEAHQNLAAYKHREAENKAMLANSEAKLQRSQGGITSALAAGRQEGIDRESYESDAAGIKKAQADLKQARLQLSYTRIVAPISGRIGRKSAEVGQHIEAGQLLMALVQDKPWITANFKETQVGRMKLGQDVDIEIDSFAGRKFKGHIDSIAPASGAKFSLLPPDNATGNFTKVVQRVPVKIVFDEASIASVKDEISPGMSCVVTVIFKK